MAGLSYWHQPGADALPFMTVGQLAGQAAARFAEREALVSVEEGVRMSFEQLLSEVKSWTLAPECLRSRST